jgi:hypothetical protein
MATASMYVTRCCGDEEAPGAGGGGPDVAVVAAVVFGGRGILDDFDFMFWRFFAKARRK